MRMHHLLVPLVEGEGGAEGEQHQRHDERVEVAAAPVSERMQRVGLLAGLVLPKQKQALIGGVGDRVHGLGEHRRATGDDESDELGGGNARVRRECCDDGALATGRGHVAAPSSDADGCPKQRGRLIGDQPDRTVVGGHPGRRTTFE